jgi:hypothetical protein
MEKASEFLGLGMDCPVEVASSRLPGLSAGEALVMLIVFGGCPLR